MEDHHATSASALKRKSHQQSPSDFSFSLTRVAISQICHSVGFRGSESSALRSLTRIAALYIQTAAKSAAANANSAGRKESNLCDVVYALEDLASVKGFTGGSKVRRKSILCSGVLVDIMNFCRLSDEIPFAKPVPRTKNLAQREAIRAKNSDEVERSRHIPPWLPAFPDRITCEAPNFGKRKKPGLWGDFDESRSDLEMKDRNRKGEESIGGGKERERSQLGEKRDKVEFKIGVELRRGTCRRLNRVSRENGGDREKKPRQQKSAGALRKGGLVIGGAIFGDWRTFI